MMTCDSEFVSAFCAQYKSLVIIIIIISRPLSSYRWYLCREGDSVDGVFGSSSVRAAEVKEDLAGTELVRERSTRDVDKVRPGLIDDQPNIVAGVNKNATNLWLYTKYSM